MNSLKGLWMGMLGGSIGAALLALIGFGVGGWMTAGEADAYAKEFARSEVIASMVPICVAQAQRDPNSDGVIEYINSSNGFIQVKMLMQTGWATMPGATSPDSLVARACVRKLLGML